MTEWNADKHNMMIAMVHDLMRQKDFLKLASTFRPHVARGFDKIRVGSDYDGGYVMLDDYAGIKLGLSFGVETNATWDLALANRNIPVWQYDHTIEEGPIDHENIKFHRVQIVPVAVEGGTTISEILKKAQIDQPGTAILKIDIEHDEWDVFDKTTVEELGCFKQILVEMHAFSRASDRLWLERANRVMAKLHQNFDAVHVHANNWTPMIAVSNVSFPETLEVSFANRNCFDLVPSEELFPTQLDQPNNPLLPDIFLGNFRYG
jgi:hypothetical protein